MEKGGERTENGGQGSKRIADRGSKEAKSKDKKKNG